MIGLLLAGGRGTRLSAITKNEIPKPMARLCGKPLIEHAIERFREAGITEIYVSVGHLGNVIEDYLGEGTSLGVRIRYLREETPLGSGGALALLRGRVDGTLAICPADAIFDIDLAAMEAFHREKGALVTLFAHPNTHPYDSDLILADTEGRVSAIHPKNSPRDFYYRNCVNAGALLLDSAVLDRLESIEKRNLEHDIVAPLIASGRVYAYRSTEYIKDAGTPERFAAVERDLQSGLVAARRRSRPQRAVFLDRDGTLNAYRGFIRRAEDIELLPKVGEAIRRLNASPYLAVVVSNQPVIARGEADVAEVERMFARLETLLGKEGAYLDAVYYCPHHPHKGYEGEIAELKIDCDCRKPKIGLLARACEELGIDLASSFMVGDTETDVLTGKNAGMPSVFVAGGAEDAPRTEPAYRAADLADAVSFILEGRKEEL